MKLSTGSIRIAAVILAAGKSSRFGSNKLVTKLGGKPVIEWSIDSLSKVEFRRILIVTNGLKEAYSFRYEGIENIVNERFQEGIGTSIARATGELKDEVDAILFLLGDQPLVGPDNIEKLVKQFLNDPRKVAAFSVGGKVRNPMIFPSGFFKDLLCLSGDNGAREIAVTHEDSVAKIEIDPALLSDIDVVEDIDVIERYLERTRKT
ncbi:MAG: nucleotidyltransferase family protein [Candidatus Thermoplasmatota archaeon]|jgi:molybdenum cofactor cytidylyltransferase|nr:nucleotidyltransferase family protein [Candidatus Thermoplasmatota archaeon]MCL5874069.1 nucleotidyltransferase family protein [Candidatus Thermoplasmatota archaeon]